MPAIDNLMLFRCVQVVRRLSTKNREIGLFCNIAAMTLRERRRVQAVPRFPRRQPRAGAVSGVRVPAGARARSMGPIEQRMPCGARRARLPLLDRSRHRSAHRAARARRPRLPLRQGAGRAAARPDRISPRDIHPADFSDLLGRFGIDLIAERIESEEHGGRPARLRRPLRPGLPVLAAAAGARRGAAGRRRAARSRAGSADSTRRCDAERNGAAAAAQPSDTGTAGTHGATSAHRAAETARTVGSAALLRRAAGPT